MEVVILLCVLYFVPLLINSILLYKDDSVKTVGDFIDCSWTVLIPVVNFFFTVIYSVHKLIEVFSISKYWNKFLNIKIK